MSRFAVIAVVLTCCLPAVSRADEASHKAALQEMFKVTHMDEVMTKTIETMLDQQVQQNPQIAKYRHVMSVFFQRYMSWQSLEADMMKIYMDEFTEDEIKKLTEFYRTPLGQKAITKAPAMMAKGAEIGQQRVQKNLGELRKMMADEDAKQK